MKKFVKPAMSLIDLDSDEIIATSGTISEKFTKLSSFSEEETSDERH